ncbi:DUF2357 domain-containing protein [Cohnella ginsengisoli]|uniref:DUF2357 domain-containing protein n=2 Tax=Cohnella ginsengisoli TaxID=425004 RepID=A0A9X4KHG2_9BACL|nr:DUF2357 domain-containing protein [Cohnella ginsengisoli]MDG0792252.1 DUF2357 domain-containing protein [Cohnella ginsengisoli]
MFENRCFQRGKRLLSGVLNFQNEVGYTELELRRDGKPVFRLQLEIFPLEDGLSKGL